MSNDEQQNRVFVAVGELATDLPDVQVPARCGRPRHFTQPDQVTQLVSASEADADVGFSAVLGQRCQCQDDSQLGDDRGGGRRASSLCLNPAIHAATGSSSKQ